MTIFIQRLLLSFYLCFVIIVIVSAKQQSVTSNDTTNLGLNYVRLVAIERAKSRGEKLENVHKLLLNNN